ncbi:cytochrome P450 [Sciscionella sediminilitoris]|uniref:cytochrome P450 n=1 Tax=Sciscionella sediminilitoris TaxID=1445613 RepID=UPI00068A6F09|nr:cytochrome P450 [Sciscionella sp. SE31]
MDEDDLGPVPEVDGGPALTDWLTRMRAEHPVWEEQTGIVHVFRYSDVQSVISDPDRFSNDASRVVPVLEPLTRGHINSTDPPLHAKLRKLVAQAFSPRTVSRLEPRIRAIVDELLEHASGDRIDLVDTLSYPLPVMVIAELLGVPAGDRELFRKWADGLLNLEVDYADPDLYDRIDEQTREMNDYLRAHCRDRRRRPREDLITQLTLAQLDGERLTDEEIVKFSNTVLMVGHITTTLLVGNTITCLSEHQEIQHEVRADRGLIPATINEVLRYRSPFTTVSRVSTAEVEIAGTVVPANRMISPWIISANHDERQFTDPQRFDIHRTEGRPIAFGHGIHYCLGAALAGTEARIALDALLDRYAEIGIDTGGPIRYHQRGMYGAQNLPLLVRPA